MLKKCFLLFAAILMATILMGQTNPSPQTVPYSQNFSDLAHNSTAYPNGWQGWSVPGSPGSDFKTTAPGGDRTLTASSSASTTSGNVHNYDGKIGTLNNSSTDLTLALALNTTGTQNVTVVYDVMTIRNPYDGGSNTRINEITLQYRVGTTGTFNTLTGIEYQNNTVTQTTGTTPQNLQNMVISLPPDCDNQEVVQIRWITRQASGGGSRPSFAIDNIDISADPISNDPAINITQNLGQFITYVGIPSEVQTYHLSGISLASPISIATSLPFQIRLPEGEWLTVLEVASDFSGTIEVRFNPSSAGAVNLPLSHVSFDAEMNQIAEFFILSGNAVDATPTINVTSNLTAFNTIVENPSAAQSYTLSGLFLTGNISLSLTDPVNFEISTDGGSNYAPTGSVASDFNGLIYVRMTGVAVGSFSANITHSSPGAGTVNTAISGTVNNPAAPMIFFEENFDYSASSTLVSNGWTAHSGTGTNSPYVTTPNLTYPSYPLFSGLSAYLRPSGEDVHRTFTPATEGSVYASFLVSVEAASTGGDYFFHLGPDPISTTFRARVFVKTDASNNLAFGILKGSITAETAWTGFDYSLNSTYLVLVKYDIIPGDGNDTVALWINPDFSATEPAPQVTATDSNSDISVASVAVRQGNAGNLVSGLVDGIRISNNWNLHWQQTAVDGDILVSGEMEPFLAIAGAPSERQFYHVQGQDLTSNITIQAPDGFELSISNDVNDPWDGVLTVPPTFNGNVFVRMLVPEPGLYAGNIVHTSGGADPVSFSVNGEAFEPAGEIIVAADFTPFYGTTTTPSAVQSYNLSGSDLSGDIFVSVANPYQIKVSSSETWTNSLQLPSTFNGSIDVRLNSTTAGTFNATLLHESAEASNVDINLSGTVSVGVPDLATLRTMSTGTTVYTVTGEVYLTFQQAFRNQKFVQDATAGILIDDFNAVISTAFNPGDGITNLTGTISEYGGMLQFVPTRNPLAASSTGNVINPQPISLAQLESNFEAYESELVKVLNVSFTAPGSFANGSMYQITDGNITFPFRTTFYDVDYIGTVIPETAKDIVGIPNSRVSEGNNFTARSLADFSDPVAAIATKLAITSIDPASPYINTAFSVSIQSLGDDNAPVNVDEDTQITLSLATGTGTLSGTLTGTILTGSNSASLSGVLYNTAETGVSITASATSGQTLLPVTSAAFEVLTIPDNPTVTALARPAQIDLSAATSQSAVLMQLQSYPTDDVRYRLYNGGNQYNCWDGTQYVSSTSYSGGPQPLGTPSTSATWWIIFERGSNINPAASYRDRQGPAYDSNFQTLALPAATAIADPFNINMVVPINPRRYVLTNKYVVLGYDQETGGTLITATSTDLNTGAFSLKVESGTVIRRIEVRSLDNNLMESLIGEWDGQGGDEYYADVTGLSGSALRAGLKTITSTGQINNSWDNTRYHIYASLDNVNNTVSCVYTGAVYDHPAGEQSTPAGLSAEHSYPQEWFSGHAESSLMETDLHALFPANQAANSARSNYPYDYVTNISSTWGSGDYFSYGGTNSGADNAFDVADEFKGDAARAILYMGMRYYDDDQNFTRFDVNLLPIMLVWHQLDPVDDYETARNTGVYAFQGNRNPFVDHPEWVNDIWGDIAIDTPVATIPSNLGDHGFTANWNAVAAASSYRFDLSTSPIFAGFVNGYKNKVVSATSLDISALDPSTTYYYRIRALGSNGELSLNSNTIYASTTAGGTLAYYWNFNSNVPGTGVNWTQPVPASIGQGNITYNLTKAVSFGGTTLNGEAGEVSGGSFVPQGGDLELENNGNWMELALPTTGLQDLILTYAARRTSTGFNSHEIYYSLGGTDFTLFTTITDLPSDWLVSGVKSIDFSSLGGANNNPDFKIRIVFLGATTVSGNNRIDNIKIFASPTGGEPLASPQNLQIINQNGQVQISWDAVTGATSYRIEHADDPEGTFSTADTTTNLNWTAAASSKKFYRVIAIQ